MFGLIEKAYALAGESTPVPGGSSIGDYNHLLANIKVNILNPIITLLVALAIIYFLWGVFEFVRHAESSEERKKGGMHMLFGALGLFIMVTAYGIINLILGTLKG